MSMAFASITAAAFDASVARNFVLMRQSQPGKERFCDYQNSSMVAEKNSLTRAIPDLVHR
jgi:hypothetical protein